MPGIRERWQSLREQPFPGDPSDPRFNLELAAWDTEAAGIVDGIVSARDTPEPERLRALRARLADLSCYSTAEEEYAARWKSLLDLLLE